MWHSILAFFGRFRLDHILSDFEATFAKLGAHQQRKTKQAVVLATRAGVLAERAADAGKEAAQTETVRNNIATLLGKDTTNAESN